MAHAPRARELPTRRVLSAAYSASSRSTSRRSCATPRPTPTASARSSRSARSASGRTRLGRLGPGASTASSALPDELAERIVKRRSSASDASSVGGEPDDVLDDFLDYIDDADAIVAYNGRSFDFPLLDEAIERLGEAIPQGVRRIDGLYLAHRSLAGPAAPARPLAAHQRRTLQRDPRAAPDRPHRPCRARRRRRLPLLADLCGSRPRRSRAGLRSRDARPLGRAARRRLGRCSSRWPPSRLPLSLLDGRGPGGARRQPRSRQGAPPARPPPLARRRSTSRPSATARVDIDRVVRPVRGEHSHARISQREMVAAMRSWSRDGRTPSSRRRPGPARASPSSRSPSNGSRPTPRNRVVLSTYTAPAPAPAAPRTSRPARGRGRARPHRDHLARQGRRQPLSARGARPGSGGLTAPPAASRRRGDFVGRPAASPSSRSTSPCGCSPRGTPVEEWEAHSVDPVDVEPFFERLPRRRPRGPSRRGPFLHFLSQAESRDYAAGEGAPAEHTSLVAEVSGGTASLVTNHALLLAPPRRLQRRRPDAARHRRGARARGRGDERARGDLDYGRDGGGARRAARVDPAAPAGAHATRTGATRNGCERRSDELEGFLDLETVPNLARRALDAAPPRPAPSATRSAS